VASKKGHKQQENATFKDIRYIVMGASLGIAILMLVGKLTAYAITHSVAIMADASESIVHVVATGFAAYSLWYASKPEDEHHPYGHGRITFFSAGFEGALVFVASLGVIGSGIYGLWQGPDVRQIGIGLVITVVLAIINLALGVALVTVGRNKNSLVLIANGKHVLTDVYTTAAAIAGLVLVLLTDLPILDPIAAILIGVLIMVGGISILRSAISGLMDRIRPELRDELERAVAECREGGMIRDVHELRAREVDDEVWLQMHVLFDGKISVAEAHQAVTDFEKCLEQTLVDCRLRISSHIEPAEHDQAHPEGH
jgi:cation diffusion facilitator family transporter